MTLTKCPRCEKYGEPISIRAATTKEKMYRICEWCGWKLKEVQ